MNECSIIRLCFLNVCCNVDGHDQQNAVKKKHEKAKPMAAVRRFMTSSCFQSLFLTAHFALLSFGFMNIINHVSDVTTNYSNVPS